MEKPDFFLVSSEGRPDQPRRCFRLQRVLGRSGDDYLLVRIDPPIIGQPFGLGGRDIDRVILATKYVGSSLFPISEWPMSVHVARLLRELRKGDTLTKEDLEVIDWAQLYSSKEEALRAASFTR